MRKSVHNEIRDEVVSCSAENNLRKIRLVTLRTRFLGFCTRQQGLNAVLGTVDFELSISFHACVIIIRESVDSLCRGCTKFTQLHVVTS